MNQLLLVSKNFTTRRFTLRCDVGEEFANKKVLQEPRVTLLSFRVLERGTWQDCGCRCKEYEAKAPKVSCPRLILQRLIETGVGKFYVRGSTSFSRNPKSVDSQSGVNVFRDWWS